MVFTKKHYEHVAGYIRSIPSFETREILTEHMVEMFKADSEKFQEHLFRKESSAKNESG